MNIRFTTCLQGIVRQLWAPATQESGFHLRLACHAGLQEGAPTAEHLFPQGATQSESTTATPALNVVPNNRTYRRVFSQVPKDAVITVPRWSVASVLGAAGSADRQRRIPWSRSDLGR